MKNRVTWNLTPQLEDIQPIAQELIIRLHNQDRLKQSILLSSQQSTTKYYVKWQNNSLMSGYAGLCILDAYLDTCYPDQSWDRSGHYYLQLATTGIESNILGLASGLSGIAFAAFMLSRNRERYSKLLTRLDNYIIIKANEHLASIRKQHHGILTSSLDVISGITGVGGYLLLRADQPEFQEVILDIANVLTAISEEQDEIPHWFVPPNLIMQEHWRPLYPQGLLDSGLAHGIAGPLALLSLIKSHNLSIPNLDDGILRMAEWLISNRCDDEWGINWSAAYPIKGIGEIAQPSRCAWCYGPPGIARSLWLAGEALNYDRYRQFAIETMADVYNRPIISRRIDAPGICHGIAGLLQITLRFMNDTDLSLFSDAVYGLTDQLIDLYDPLSLMGYRDIELDHFIDRSDLLNGTIGIALVLLSASHNIDPLWDRMLLIA